MVNKNVYFKNTEKALVNFENIKECIQGLYEILDISLSPDDMYFKMGQDNIEALYQNFLELMINEIGTNEFMRKIRRSEIDLDITLDDTSK